MAAFAAAAVRPATPLREEGDVTIFQRLPVLAAVEAAPFGRAFLDRSQTAPRKQGNRDLADARETTKEMTKRIRLLEDVTLANVSRLTYYELLGLGDFGFQADQETIRTACALPLPLARSLARLPPLT